MLPKELVEEAAGGVKGKEGTADPGVVDGDVHGGQMGAEPLFSVCAGGRRVCVRSPFF